MAEPPASSTSVSSGHLTAMQLFYELKQKFPTAPDPVVSECIRQSGNDPVKCEALLRASCTSRGFPAAVAATSTSNTSVAATALARRRFSAPPSSTSTRNSAGVVISSATSNSSGTKHHHDVLHQQPVSRERSTGRNSMCALAERSTSIGDRTSSISTSNNSVHTTTINTENINNSSIQQQTKIITDACDNNSASSTQSASNLRAKLRPTFLNTRPPSSFISSQQHQQQQGLSFLNNLRRGSNPFNCINTQTNNNNNNSIDDNNTDNNIRSPFLGGPLQEPHKYQCTNLRRRSLSLNKEEHNQGETTQEYYSETYKCSVNTQTRVQDWLPPLTTTREPTPPPRPPLPSNMVQEPLLPPPSSRYFHHHHETSSSEDFFHQDYEVSVNCSAHGVHVTSTCSSPISAGPLLPGSPVFPSSIQQPIRHTASLHVHPTPHFQARPSSNGEPRSYTSVNLTLRPASSEPQPPIDIRSASSRLTYSTSSYNPIQGFQSQLHIEIGAGCGTVSAVRTAAATNGSSPIQTPTGGYNSMTGGIKQHQVLVRTISPLTPDKQLLHFGNTTQAGLARQMERKAKLEMELRREKERLRIMKTEVQTLKDDLHKRQARKAIAPLKGPLQSASQKAEQLRAEIKSLQEECKRMTQEVDLHGSQVPLGETDEEFYQNIYTGQRGFVLPPENFTHPFQGSFTIPSPIPVRNINTTPTTTHPLSRPGRLSMAEVDEEEEEDGPHWTCSVCTFRNHPALSKCEQCEMPRITLGTDSHPPQHATTASCFCHPPKPPATTPPSKPPGSTMTTPSPTTGGARPFPLPPLIPKRSSLSPTMVSPSLSSHAVMSPDNTTPSPTAAMRPLPPPPVPRRPSPVPPSPVFPTTSSTSPS